MADKGTALNLNLRVTPDTREALQTIAEANGMSISQLIRFLSLKVLDKPADYGLLVPKVNALALGMPLN